MTKNIRIQKVLSYACIVTLVGDQNLNRPIFLLLDFFVILKEIFHMRLFKKENNQISVFSFWSPTDLPKRI